MAGGDYMKCSFCGAKVLYDVDCDYDAHRERIAEILAMCSDCERDGHRLVAVKNDGTSIPQRQLKWSGSYQIIDWKNPPEWIKNGY